MTLLRLVRAMPDPPVVGAGRKGGWQRPGLVCFGCGGRCPRAGSSYCSSDMAAVTPGPVKAVLVGLGVAVVGCLTHPSGSPVRSGSGMMA
jgi:hypothetical protein